MNILKKFSALSLLTVKNDTIELQSRHIELQDESISIQNETIKLLKESLVICEKEILSLETDIAYLRKTPEVANLVSEGEAWFSTTTFGKYIQ